MHNATTCEGELSTVHGENHLSKKDIFGVKSEMQKESEGGAGVSESESQGVPPLTSPLGAVYCQDPA